MQKMNNNNLNQNNGVNLLEIIQIIFSRKLLLIIVTSISTLIGITYVSNIIPTYRATSTFIAPDKSSIFNINASGFLNEDKDSVFNQFLSTLNSPIFQIKVFNDEGFLSRFNLTDMPTEGKENFASKFVSSIEISRPNIQLSDLEVGLENIKPYSISIHSGQVKGIAEFIDALVFNANLETINSITSLSDQKIKLRLSAAKKEKELLLSVDKKEEEALKDVVKEFNIQTVTFLDFQIELLRAKAKKERLNRIVQIKELDAQTLREINDEIFNVRFQAEEERLNEMALLNDAIIIARSLGFTENNLELDSHVGFSPSSNLTIELGEIQILPVWYLYGETALMEKIKLLENRTSNDPFIPKLVTLKNRLYNVKNNNLLKTLESRTNDDPYVPEILNLQNQIEEIQGSDMMYLYVYNEKNRLGPFKQDKDITKESIAELNKLTLEIADLEFLMLEKNTPSFNSMILTQNASIQLSSKKNTNMIVWLSLLAGILLSILLSLIIDAFNREKLELSN